MVQYAKKFFPLSVHRNKKQKKLDFLGPNLQGNNIIDKMQTTRTKATEGPAQGFVQFFMENAITLSPPRPYNNSWNRDWGS